MIVLSKYLDVLRINEAWKFSISGLIMRMPMAMIGIATILSVKAAYGNYTLAGAVGAANILATCACAPLLARLVDEYGQRRVMFPSLLASAAATLTLAVAIVYHAPAWLLFAASMIAGATWGSPGALVRSRWARVADRADQLGTAYALEAAFDEFAFIVGPILATVLGTMLHPVTGLLVAVACFLVGSTIFFAQRATEPVPRPRSASEKRRSVLANPVVLVLMATYIGAGALFGANDVAVVEFAQEQGAASASGILLAIFSFGSCAAALAYGSRNWRSPIWKLFAAGVLALAVGVSTFLFAHSLVMLAVVMLITGAACAPTMTNVNTIVTRVFAPVQLTEGLTWTTTALNVGVSLGSAVGGRLVDAAGSHGGFMVEVGAAWLMVAFMLVGLPLLRRKTGATDIGSQTIYRDEDTSQFTAVS
ncbi:MFS transporter [Propionimicrobium sp. PCR01-08-3]|uniref:MFS transporter n=1 Tax=Propionimicrobium sp. PCR01-08-3 TaxID=3052086 RepID=UPI00255C6D7B|nr:MFS transporter [Propionimicrobium sp. PCR01-08-3]WIY82078.1 MFS transporter [Propionimicrobium sp. PCR01-08-3]